jgi:hypothetical protein
MFRRTLLLLALCLPLTHAQELAHPGWRGNRIAPEVWYRHTTIVRFPAATTFEQAAAGMDAMSTVGADSLILPDLQPPAGAPHPFADTVGTEEQLDTLMRETSARRMHVLLQAPLARLAANPGELRFWMNRGISGFDLGTITQADLASLQTLRTALDHFPGQRILLARWGDIAFDRKAATHTMPQAFRIVSDAAPAASSAPQFVELAAAPAPDSKDPTAALLRTFLPLLLAQGQPIFDSRIIATNAGRDALQQMLQFRSSHPSLRTGAIVLESGDLHAWLIKASGSGQHPIVIVENSGTAPATLHLEQALHKANARGTFLRPILRTDGGMGALNLEAGTIPPGAFAICELQY